jgi:hypothetical protein
MMAKFKCHTVSIHLYFSLSWYNIYEVTKQSTISITKKEKKQAQVEIERK